MVGQDVAVGADDDAGADAALAPLLRRCLLLAARQAVATASRTVRNIQTVEVVKSSAVVQDGEIVEYRVELKIGFEYEG